MKKPSKLDLINFFGFKLKAKVVVFESDDWGMIRTRSKDALNNLRAKGYLVDACSYNRFDSVERDKDLSGLMEVLAKHKGKDGKSAKFTLNNVVANPDFERIFEADYREYFYKPFTETLLEYTDTESVMDLYQEGLAEELFQVQYHAREHVNVNRWLSALQSGNQRFLDAFKEKQFTVAGQGRTSGRKDFLDSFGRAYSHEFESEESIITSGAELFKKIWGFESRSFIAPCYTWSSGIESILKENGVRYLQGTHVQRAPAPGLELKIQKKYHWQGKRNRSGLLSIVRNVMFEPSEHLSDTAVVDRALAEIENAFFWGKPAVISSHRVNFMGRLDEDNRSKNLKLLDKLLERLRAKHPDIVFRSSDELGEIYSK